MIFQITENGCRALIDFHGKRLTAIQKDIDFLQLESSSATELAVRFAIDEALAKNKYDKSRSEIKIRELEQYLASASVPIGSAAT